jgi:hypothetical protein
MNAAARTRARFEHRYVVTKLREFISSNKPGHSSAQYEHLPGRAANYLRRHAPAQRTANQPGGRGRDCAAPQKLTAS